MYAYVGGNPVNYTDPWGLRIRISDQSGRSHDINPNRVVGMAIVQIMNNPELKGWFDSMLAKKGETISNILTGKHDVTLTIYPGGLSDFIGETRCDGFFPETRNDIPNMSIGLNADVFDYSWWHTDAGDEQNAASWFIHELGHYVDAYTLDKNPGIETGEHLETLIKW